MARRGAIDSERLAALYSDGRRSKDPVAVAHKIEQIARTPDRLSSDVAPSTALTMAAELCHQHGAIAEALRLVETALATRGPEDDRATAPALRAMLLAQSGRRDEALEILEELRPSIGISFEASTAVPDALEQIGETGLAIEWLTAAVHELSPRVLGETADPIDAHLLQVMIATRARLRASAGLEPDHLDVLAETAPPSPNGTGTETAPRTGRIALLYWPQKEFDELARKWPDVAAGYGGGSWSGHRAEVEKVLQTYTNGGVRLAVVSADLAGFLEFTAAQGVDPKTAEARATYAAELGRRRQGITYPPTGRNALCWCGSGRKFRKCCGGEDTGLVRRFLR